MDMTNTTESLPRSELVPTDIDEQQSTATTTETKKKKKKGRGNRKEQHKRRRLRRRQQREQQQQTSENSTHLDQEIVVDSDMNHNGLQLEQIQASSLDDHEERRSAKKRKRPQSNKEDSNVNRSFSQLSISQENKPKKKRTITMANMHSNPELSIVSNGHPQQLEQLEQQQQNINDIQRHKSQYLRVPDQVFKEMLSNAIPNGEQLVQCLNSKEKLQFVRQMTEITNRLQYLDLQRHSWQDYYDLGLKEGRWQVKVSKTYAKEHQTCRTYGLSQHIIEKRQQTIQRQLQQTVSEFQASLMRLEEYSKEWQPSFDPNLLSHAIHECVRKGQQRLREEFDYRRKMFVFNSNDHHLLAAFYQLQPNEAQIDLAKMIWKTTLDELKHKEYEEVLRKRIYLQRLPSGIDRMINQSVDPIQLLLANPAIDHDQRASLASTCSKTLTQYKFDLMTINLNTIQNIAHGHEKLLVELKQKLCQADWTPSVKQAIEQREQMLIERHQIHLQHKLKTFFDEAPTASEQ